MADRTTMRAAAYLRVSTDEQGDSRAGLQAQEATIHAALAHRGWTLTGTYTDVASGKSVRKRPQLAKLTEDLAAGRADVLMVAKLDRLSRSTLDFATLMTRAAADGWSIVALDIGIDTSTTNGRMLANIIMALAQWERETISDRTRASLTAVRSRGTRLGRPPTRAEETVRTILQLRSEGRSYAKIADWLNEVGVPTAQGGARWYPSTVRAMEQAVGSP